MTVVLDLGMSTLKDQQDSFANVQFTQLNYAFGVEPWTSLTLTSD